MVVVAALAEATADTLASELGEVLGGPPFLVTTLRRVAPGTDGAVSLAGHGGGNGRSRPGGAGGGVYAWIRARRRSLLQDLGAVGGLFVDSLLGATAERRGWLNNDAVNFLSTFAALAGCLAICDSFYLIGSVVVTES